ncbi:MAG: hypothetical protein QMD44_09450 [Thermodesulfovibrionales bacterium]|jgi:hypothetical protein|nr:hypothetical protein [Thermodesulfovibrionales bacterium]
MRAEGQSTEFEVNCPLPNTHSRLSQSHRLWHQVLETYNDHEGFRANLNAAIEALRNVTFMLQNEKHAIPEFDRWYAEWREKMKADPVMLWLCEARTIVVHNSDLETQSTAIATVHNNLSLAHISLELPPMLPFDTACELVATTLPEPFSSNKKDLVLSIERRWVAKQLPDWELLEALAHAYGVLSNIVKEAHERAGFRFESRHCSGGKCSIPTDGRLPCMITTAEIRTARIALADGASLVCRQRPFQMKREQTMKAVKRYGFDKFKVPLTVEGDPFHIAESLLPLAKQILQKDKYHVRIMFLRTPQQWTIRQIDARDRAEKYALIRTLANEIRQLHVDALIEISEVWMSSVDEFKAGRLPSEARDKKEALVVIVATSDGNCRQYITMFKRNMLGQIKLEKTEVVSSTPSYLAPILEVWGVNVSTRG